ncbi:RNA-binding protein [Aliiruegeria sabulilitoris]|uniref:RNA-binding protein n=1 Tax=Aliiruegeria sabulilitoris TaxID=1510458 RepID=UPI0008359E09|nr:RNA-binding protein [Aliiruegeria sabulilitoris]NDR57484.1 RNA-binding protein [Pseudoruegeria sp. M32A2M]
MGRGGIHKDREAASERKCAATGETRPKAEMIRFVVGPDGGIVPDLAGKLPGRGIWVTATRDALALAVKKKAFSRGAKRQVAVPEGLVDAIEAGLARRVTDTLSLARKAGLAMAGYEKVRGLIQNGEVVVLLQASDGSERGKSKLRLPPEEGAYFDCLTAHEMGLSFGRDHVIHAALCAGGLTTRVVEEATRLSGLRGNIGADGPGKDDGIA